MTDRLIPEGKVWKVVYEVSHAPHYVRQFENGTFATIYAPVEKVPGNNAVPIGLSEEQVIERARDNEHADVVELPVEQSPWAEGTYL